MAAEQQHQVNRKMLWEVLGPHRGKAVKVLALQVLNTAFASLGVGMVLPVFQALLAPDHQSRLLSLLLPILDGLDPDMRMTAIAGATILLFSIKAAISVWTTVSNQQFLQQLRFFWIGRIGEHYLYGPYLGLVSKKQGELLNNWFNETLAASRFYQSYVQYFSSGMLALALISLGLSVNWQAMMVMLTASILLMLLVRRRVYGTSVRHSRLKLQLNQMVTASMVENLANIRDLKLMLAESIRLAQLATTCRNLRSVLLRTAVMAELPGIVGEFLAVLALMTFVVLGVAVMEQSPQEMLPVLAFFFIAFYRLISALSVVMSARIRSLNELHSVGQVHALIHQQEAAHENLDRGLPLQSISTDIFCHSLSFAYNGTDNVLSDVTVRIPRGKLTFLLGPSGSGKSTLLDLLMRLAEPDQGRFEANSQSAGDFRLTDWRKCFGYVSQEVTLFNGSIRMNLQLARPDAGEAEMEAACRLAGAADFIGELPDGMDTIVGERGYSLSGGQRKRIAIARALIRKPDVLILDEATTSFEQSLEREILDNLRATMPELSVIQVTHRLSETSTADWVIALEQGRVMANGPWNSTVLSSFCSVRQPEE